jgi:mono/diheme cytochrome c family protein
MKRSIGLCLLGLLAACGSESEPEELSVVQQYMNDEIAVLRGEAIYAGSCASFCHGLTPEVAGEEFGSAANLFDCQWKYGGSDEEIFSNVVTGITGTAMVGFGSNFPEGDEDLWKLIAFLRSKQASCDNISPDSQKPQNSLEQF